jgi:hypothetical protein
MGLATPLNLKQRKLPALPADLQFRLVPLGLGHPVCLLATPLCVANEILLRACLLVVALLALAVVLLLGAILWGHLLSVTRATMLAQELTIEHVQFIV